MVWLEAALAFAITMLIFATMVSVIVEAGMRIFLVREGGFRKMMEQLFDEMVEPRLSGLLAQASIDPRNDFIGKLATNPAMPKATGPLVIIRNWLVPRETTSMTVMEFAERLADTELGQKIAAQTDAHVEVLVKDMAQKFEHVGAAATAYYTRRAATISMLVAVLFAYAANVDAVRLIRTFVDNQQLTTSIIARSEEVKENHLQQQLAMQKLVDEIQKSAAGERGDGESPDLKELRETATQLQDELSDLAAQGLPVTYEFFPACPVDSIDPRCEAYLGELGSSDCAQSTTGGPFGGKYGTSEECVKATHSWWGPLLHDPTQTLGWFLSVLLSGFLIGLGGPFWYDLVSSLTRIVQLARTAGAGQKPKQKESAAEPSAVVQASDQPRNPVEAFKTAAQAISVVSASAGGRIPLSPSGEALREDGR